MPEPRNNGVLSNEDLGRLLSDLMRQVEELRESPAISNLLNPTSQSVTGSVVMIANPTTLVSGTTTAVTAWTAINLAGYAVPANAKAVILNSEIELGSGGGIQTTVKGGTWTSGINLAMGISGGGVGERSCGSGIVPCTGRSISYKVTDQAGGGTTSAWVSYNITLIGYLV